MNTFEGVFVAMITPFTKENEVDIKALKNYCDYLLEKKADGLFICGSTGEFPFLDQKERMLVAETVISHAAGRIPVVVHCGSSSHKETENLASHAVSAGASALAFITPSFYEYDRDCLINYFIFTDKAAEGRPWFIYNIPSRTNTNITPDLYSDICRSTENLKGIKFSSDDFPQYSDIFKLKKENQTAFIGNDSLIYKSSLIGNRSVVSGTASAFPEILKNLCNYINAGDSAKAEKCQKHLDAIGDFIDENNEIQGFREILRLNGIETGNSRIPFRSFNRSELEMIKENYKKWKD